MKKFVVALAAVLLTGCVSTGPDYSNYTLRSTDIVIQEDRGGYTDEYSERANRITGRVVIDGLCASACTFYLAKACATTNARIAFHSARYAPGVLKKYNTLVQRAVLEVMLENENEKMLNSYPPAVRAWVLMQGGYPKDGSEIWLTGREAVEVIGACS